MEVGKVAGAYRFGRLLLAGHCSARRSSATSAATLRSMARANSEATTSPATGRNADTASDT